MKVCFLWLKSQSIMSVFAPQYIVAEDTNTSNVAKWSKLSFCLQVEATWTYIIQRLNVTCPFVDFP